MRVFVYQTHLARKFLGLKEIMPTIFGKGETILDGFKQIIFNWSELTHWILDSQIW